MPSVPRPGIRPIYVELEQDLADRLAALAKRNRRTLKAEITIGLEKHVGGKPPTLEAIFGDREQAVAQVAAEPGAEEQTELPTTRGRYLLFIGEPILKGRPRWVHFSWRNERFCLRDFLTGSILRQDAILQVTHVWRAALRKKPATGEYFHPVGDWKWWKRKLEELSND